MERAAVAAAVDRAIAAAKITDIHTHLFAPAFGELLLWGPDALLTYHYLIAEALRWRDLPYDAFWRLSTAEQADLIWQTLFIEHTPVSEACRGVVSTFRALGFDLAARDLEAIRRAAADIPLADYLERVLALSGVERLAMTNDPFDPQERAVWLQGFARDPRFLAVLRLDPLLNAWPEAQRQLSAWGYDVDVALSARAIGEVRRFLRDWIARMEPVYLAVSLPPDFAFPDASSRGRLLTEAVLPICREFNLPLAMMIGVKRQVNPSLRAAGDGVGKADLAAVERLCAGYPQNKFLCTLLSRENQHELAVIARKFRNLLIFGCWWFLNNPTLVSEITRMRTELLGVSFIPQHSDARILDQLVYKWEHSKRLIAEVLTEKYADAAAAGWPLTEAEIARDVADLFGGNFWRFHALELR